MQSVLVGASSYPHDLCNFWKRTFDLTNNFIKTSKK